jgi:hypothetical protein
LETVVTLAATNDGIRDVETGTVALAGRDVTHLVCRGDTWWALVDGGQRVFHAQVRGDWEEIARVEGARGRCLHPLSNGGLLVGTEGAHVLRLEDGVLRRLASFDAVPGRDRWKNPASAEPDVWSFADVGESVFVSVHVGGLWRSDDQGETWTASLEPAVDVHQVAASGGAVMVAAARGFAWSRDAGHTWAWTTSGCTPRTSSRSPPRATPSSSAQRAARSPRIAPFTVRRPRALRSSGARAGSRGASRPSGRTA